MAIHRSFAALAIMATPMVAAGAEAPAKGPRWVIVLRSSAAAGEPMARCTRAFTSALSEAPDTRAIFVRSEEVQLNTPLTETYAAWLRERLFGSAVAAIVSFETPGSDLGLAYRHSLFPAVPLVCTGLSAERFRAIAAGLSNVTALTVDHDVGRMLDAAASLAPRVTGVTFITPAWFPSPSERRHWSATAEAFCAGDRTFTDLSGFDPDAVRDAIGRVPPSQFIVFRDIVGIGFPSRTGLMDPLLAKASAPVLVAAESAPDAGAAMTSSLDHEQLGRELAGLVSKVLAARSADLPPVASSAFRMAFDARELDRWNFRQAPLPAGTTMAFTRPSLWQTHRTAVTAGAAVVTGQAWLIGMLLLQRRRRQLAESALRIQEAQLSLTHRVASLNQLATSLAHELNQPLTAIISNADALRRLVPETDAGSAAHEIAEDLAADSRRAADIIAGIRSMTQPRTETTHPLHPDDLIDAVIRLAAPEAEKRHCRLEHRRGTAVPMVEGSAVQLQQAILNLVINALEALRDASAGPAPHIIVATAGEPDGSAALIDVADNGPGLPADRDALFSAFHTTKPHGMGMGLAIARSLVERHRGTLTALTPPAGATFRIRLPALDAPHA